MSSKGKTFRPSASSVHPVIGAPLLGFCARIGKSRQKADAAPRHATATQHSRYLARGYREVGIHVHTLVVPDAQILLEKVHLHNYFVQALRVGVFSVEFLHSIHILKRYENYFRTRGTLRRADEDDGSSILTRSILT